MHIITPENAVNMHPRYLAITPNAELLATNSLVNYVKSRFAPLSSIIPFLRPLNIPPPLKINGKWFGTEIHATAELS